MKAEVQTSSTVFLMLTESEARWLKAIVLNPFHDPESALDEEMRARFFKALSLPEIKL
jgi:hypothetical protein